MAVTLHAHTMSAVLSGNRGAVGVGIADITFNDDYTMTITLTDGSTYTSGNLRGAQGIPGIDAEFDGEELVITTGDHTETDGGEVSTIRVKGEARTIRDRVTEEMACSAYPTETASGDIVSISDGAEDIPVKALTVAVEPVQAGSGDPSPDNVRAITGWDAVNVVRCGKNLIDAVSNLGAAEQFGITVAKVGTDTIHVGGTPTANWRYITNTVDCNLPAGSYKFVTDKARTFNLYITLKFQDETTFNLILTPSVTSNAYTTDKRIISYRVAMSGAAVGVELNIDLKAMLALSSVSDDIEPYSGTTYPIPLPSTVYGGTLDVASGVMTVDRAIVEASTLAWQLDNSRFWAAVTGSTTADTRYNNACSDFIPLLAEGGTAAGNALGFTFSANSRVYIALKPLGITTLADLQAFLSGKGYKFVYPLATPQTITLDPVTITTLLGSNTVYADAGQVSVAYRADVGLYIDGKITAVMAAIAELS